VPFIGGNPLAVLTKTIIKEDGSQDPLSIASVGTSFTTTIERNLKIAFHQNQEKDNRIIELEEQLKHEKKEEGIMREFKAWIKNVRTMLEEDIMDMYAHLHVFQEVVSSIMEKQIHVHTKNIQLATIIEGLDDIKRWISKNPDALVEIPHPS
jgi:hypothetical protein